MNIKFLSPSSLRLLLILALMAAALSFPAQSVSAQPLLAAFTTCDDVTEIPKEECEALVALYNNTSGASWSLNTDWLVTDSTCSWHGVVCATGHVTSLTLDNNNLSGSIPPELGDLIYLTSLHMARNQLTGGIPPELGNLTSLLQLNLQINQLSGAIPPELGGLPDLEELFLDENQLSSTIPPELGGLLDLKKLYLSKNLLSGTIPPELENLSSLTYLFLDDNDLSGTIPPELENLTNLKGLKLSGNGLSGSIPPELGNLTNLFYLWLNDNLLSGAIPPELGSLTSLVYLILNDNDLSGSIPPELGNLTSLYTLILNDNDLSGSIPTEIGSLTSLNYLWLSGNDLSGEFPASIPNLVNLTSLEFDFCTGLGSTDPTVMAFLDDEAPGWNTCADLVISGDAGTAGATLSYINGTPQNALADANGLYSFEVPYFWSGTVTPAKVDLTFSPVNRSYTQVFEDQIHQDYTATFMIRKTFSSNNTQDGWVLANTVNNTVGGPFNSSDPTFRLGYDKNKRQYRGILSFNTSTLPDKAVVTSVTLMIRAQSAPRAGVDPERLGAGFIVDIKNGLLGTEILESKDFQVKANTSFEAMPLDSAIPSAPLPGWIGLNLTPGKDFINKLTFHKGLTQIRLRFNNTYTLANTISYYSGNAPLASRPRLMIQYYLP